MLDITMDVEAIRAEMIDRMAERHPNRTWPAGRICEANDCDTILSVYNGTDQCAAHQTARRSLVGAA